MELESVKDIAIRNQFEKKRKLERLKDQIEEMRKMD